MSSAFGPALYGVARDLLGSYPPVLTIAAGLELAALAVVLAGRRALLASSLIPRARVW
jgi:hypothetical protein